MNKNIKIVEKVFFGLVLLVLLAPLWVFKDLLFPYITSKAFYLRIVIELAFPFYLYLVLSVKQYRPSFKNPLTIAVTAFVVLNLISALFGVNPLKSLWGNFERMGGVFYLAHLSMYYFYILLLAQMKQDYMRKFVLSVISLGAVLAVYGVLVWLKILTFLPDPSYPRISATFGNPIFFASFLILPMFLTLFYLLQEDRKWMKALYGVVIGLELWSILLSQTRGAVVGLGLALFVSAVLYIALTPKRKLKIWGGVTALCLVGVMTFGFLNPEVFPQGTILRRIFNLRDGNTEARLVQWKIALKGFTQRPIIGTGAEAYSVVSNANYNPEIYNHDRSWFDKPHNYFLEVLVTSGIIGFAAYMAMIVLVLVILYRAFKLGLFGLMELCLLVCGWIAYAVQNLFVFDTIPASLMFYSFLGFVGFLWVESREESSAKFKLEPYLERGFVTVVVVLGSIAALYTIYAANIVGWRISKNVNYGYAYANVDVVKSQNYFKTAITLPFNFDPVEVGSKYGEVAINIASRTDVSKENRKQILDSAIDLQKKTIEKVSTDPTAWQRLADLYLAKAVLMSTRVDQAAFDAAIRASELAPKRPEPLLELARLHIYSNNAPAAQTVLRGLLKDIPKNTDAQVQLGLIDWYTGDEEEAISLGEQALGLGFIPRQAREIEWLGQAYKKMNDWNKAIAIYELTVKAEPNNIEMYWELAQLYAQVGRVQEATDIAASIASYDKTRAEEMGKFVKALGKN